MPDLAAGQPDRGELVPADALDAARRGMPDLIAIAAAISSRPSPTSPKIIPNIST
jgi:hypothetical protein